MTRKQFNKITAVVYLYSSFHHQFILEKDRHKTRATAFQIPISFDTNPDTQIVAKLATRLKTPVTLYSAPVCHPHRPDIIATPFAITYRPGKVSWIYLAFCGEKNINDPNTVCYTPHSQDISTTRETKEWCTYFGTLLT